MPEQSHQKTVIIIAGPTAVGKTAVAIDIATHFQTSIISADSRQCFSELNIGVARPSEEELARITHYFIASHSIQDEITAATFEAYALQKTHELFSHHDTVVIVGGTGLYIKAFCEGLDSIPAINEEVRKKITTDYAHKGLAWLSSEVQQKDPDFFEKGENQNPQRMMRALEVIESTGQSILTYRTGTKVKRDFNILKIGLELPRDILYNRINARVDQMLEQGLLDEVKNLLPYRNLNALQTVGYKELFDYLENKTSYEEAISLIKQHTRQYSKRQMTWFSRDEQIKWFDPAILQPILQWLK